MSMEKLGAFVGGALFATALREKDDVMAVVTNVKEIAGDVLAGAKAFNEKRAAEQAEVIEDTAEKAE